MWNMFQSKCVTIFLLSSDDGNAHTNTGLVLPSFLSSPGRTNDTMSQSPISQLTTPVLAQHNPSYPHNTSHYTVLIFEINLRAAHYIKWKWELVNHNTDIMIYANWHDASLLRKTTVNLVATKDYVRSFSWWIKALLDVKARCREPVLLDGDSTAPRWCLCCVLCSVM